MKKMNPSKKSKKMNLNDLKSEIIVDESKKLIFKNEEDLFAHFKKDVDVLESEYESLIQDDEYDVDKPEDYIDATLEEPDEIWMDKESLPSKEVYHFIRQFKTEDDDEFYYVATCYLDQDDSPTFVYLHFATKNTNVVDNYKRGELIFNQNLKQVMAASIEGDALSEADPLSVGLFNAMLTLRGDKDIPVEKFVDYADLREDTIEGADEIWRNPDSNGNVLVCFIKDFPDHEEKDLSYIAITQEDANSQVHALLFSFPTTDKSLVDRYRHGENLQAEEIVQESSH